MELRRSTILLDRKKFVRRILECGARLSLGTNLAKRTHGINQGLISHHTEWNYRESFSTIHSLILSAHKQVILVITAAKLFFISPD